MVRWVTASYLWSQSSLPILTYDLLTSTKYIHPAHLQLAPFFFPFWGCSLQTLELVVPMWKCVCVICELACSKSLNYPFFPILVHMALWLICMQFYTRHFLYGITNPLKMHLIHLYSPRAGSSLLLYRLVKMPFFIFHCAVSLSQIAHSGYQS